MKFFTRRVRENLLIILVIALIVSMFDLIGTAHLTDARFSDLLFLERQPSQQVVIVAIDDASIQAIGQWPWPRKTHAQMIRLLSQAGAKTIAYDVNFPEPSALGVSDDIELANVLKEKTVILPVELTLQSGVLPTSKKDLKPIEVLTEEALLAHTNLRPGADGVVRSVIRTARSASGQLVDAFGVRAAALSRAPEPKNLPNETRINFVGPPSTVTRYSFADVLSGKVSQENFKNKIVFVGATAPDLHDEQIVPTSNGVPMPGVEIHAQIAEMIIAGSYFSMTSPWVSVALIFAFAFLIGLLVTRARLRFGVIALTTVIVGYSLTVLISFEKRLILPVLWPILSALISFITLVAVRYFHEQRERERLRRIFEQYMSPAVVKDLLAHPEKLQAGGERRRMTVLFSDLRGFTSLSEGMKPETLVEVLNRYLDVMTEKVFQTNGVVDKYMGDAIMAFWGASFLESDHVDRAITTAILMRDTLNEMNRTKAWPHGVTLNLGIGLNTGEMVVGNMGSTQRFDYTVLGDSVNLGSRLEGLNKEYGTQIIVSESTKLEASEGAFLFRPLDLVAVKGKKEPVEIFEVMAANPGEGELRRKVEQFTRGLNLYRGAKFAEAVHTFEEFLRAYPDDAPGKLYLERSKEFLMNSPGEGWNGVWVYTKK